MMISIKPIPAFRDNYIWCLSKDHLAWVVDPGDAEPVLTFLKAHALTLEGILVTHHHADHTGGIAQLRQTCDVTVAGPAQGRFQPIDVALHEDDCIPVLALEFRVIEVPGHTLDHIAFYHEDPDVPLLFCGDTLFSAGCGRLFEGTPQQMYASLGKLQQLPDATQVFCAHEYTLANLAFAKAVMPSCLAVDQRITECETLRTAQQPSLPVDLGRERQYNPFLMCSDPDLRSAVARQMQEDPDSDVATFTQLRKWKDAF